MHMHAYQCMHMYAYRQACIQCIQQSFPQHLNYLAFGLVYYQEMLSNSQQTVSVCSTKLTVFQLRINKLNANDKV